LQIEAFSKISTLLESAGATIVRNISVTGARSFESLPDEAKTIILHTDMKIAINSYLFSLVINPHNIDDVHDLIEFTKTCLAEEFPLRNVEGLERANATDLFSLLYKKMLDMDEYFTGEGGIEAAPSRNRCDVMLLPTVSVTMQTFAAKAGIPAMSIPMGVYPLGTPVEKYSRNGLINVAPGIPFSAYVFWASGEG
jgi:amidase